MGERGIGIFWAMESSILEAWKLDAKCKGVDRENFFGPDVSSLKEYRNSTNSAKYFCLNCPVRSHCLSYAIEANEVYGIWGGTDPVDRRHLRINRGNQKVFDAILTVIDDKTVAKYQGR